MAVVMLDWRDASFDAGAKFRAKLSSSTPLDAGAVRATRVTWSLSRSREAVIEDVIDVACAGASAPVNVTDTTPPTTSHLITPPLRGAFDSRSRVCGKSKDYSRAAKPLQSAVLRGVVSLAAGWT